LAFTLIGLIETIVIFSAFPLIVAALSGPMLGEAVGWRRWVAIFIGFIGILVILQPGFGVFAPAALLALLSSVMFAVYSLLTRLVARQDSAETSIFYTGVFGALITTAIGIWFIEPMSPSDMLWMGTLSLTSLVGHALLIKAYTLAEASALAPFNFLHMVFVTGIGITIFGEVLEMNVVIGSIIIVGAGLFTIFRSKRANQEPL
jgi:drug/metabolite transporter (DMT)-like permease